MLDQSHNVTDPIESLMMSAVELVRAYVQAHLVDREALTEAQEKCDALMALGILKQAFTTDVAPILAVARERAGGAIDPIATYRASGTVSRKAEERPAQIGVAAGNRLAVSVSCQWLVVRCFCLLNLAGDCSWTMHN